MCLASWVAQSEESRWKVAETVVLGGTALSGAQPRSSVEVRFKVERLSAKVEGRLSEGRRRSEGE